MQKSLKKYQKSIKEYQNKKVLRILKKKNNLKSIQNINTCQKA